MKDCTRKKERSELGSLDYECLPSLDKQTEHKQSVVAFSKDHREKTEEQPTPLFSAYVFERVLALSQAKKKFSIVILDFI